MSQEEVIQQKYLEFQALEQEIKLLQQHLMNLSQQLLELKRLRQDLEELKKAKIASKVFSPLGAGIYVETELKNNSQLLINSGANVLTSKTVEEAQEIVTQRINEMTKLFDQMEQSLSLQIGSHATLSEELKGLLEQK